MSKSKSANTIWENIAFIILRGQSDFLDHFTVDGVVVTAKARHVSGVHLLL